MKMLILRNGHTTATVRACVPIVRTKTANTAPCWMNTGCLTSAT